MTVGKVRTKYSVLQVLQLPFLSFFRNKLKDQPYHHQSGIVTHIWTRHTQCKMTKGTSQLSSQWYLKSTENIYISFLYFTNITPRPGYFLFG